MIPLDTLFIFFAASVAMALSPGPDNIFVFTQSVLHGCKAGFFITLGLCTGLLVHTLIVSLGVAAIFQTSSFAFNLLKFIGAMYLLFLAWQAFKAGATQLVATSKPAMRGLKLYLRGIIMNISNPKVAVFFIAFLPQFTDPNRSSIQIQMMLFGGLFIIAAFLVFNIIAWSASYFGSRFKESDRAQLILNRIAGIVFTGLALRLVVVDQ